MSTRPWSLDPELRALLVCPLTRGELLDVDRGLFSPEADLVYPVVDGVPYLLRELAIEPTPQERARVDDSPS
ncbi:MAG: Trm112 family protein [Deltaproteobacteria bacterium]|nr:MAG: Trm112 family protein [Deltaproteobacteria bacterium]